MFVCLVFDRDADKLLKALSWITLLIAAVSDGQGPRRRRLLPVLGAWVTTLAAAGLAAWFAGDFPAAVHAFVKYQIAIVWFVVLWLAAPVLIPSLRRDGHGIDTCGELRPWPAMLVAVLILLALQATISAGASMFPKQSMELLGAEILPYVGLFIILVRSAFCAETSWWRMGARGVWILLVAVCIGMGLIAVVALTSPGLTNSLVQQGYFRIDSHAPDTPRLQFLFHHHNRAGFFAACAIFLCLAGAWGGTVRRIAGISGAAAAALALPFTLTRGALVAAGIGMALFAAAGLMRYRRGRLALLIGAVVVLPLSWVMLPSSYQGHILKITNPANYHENAEGSIGARLLIWDTTFKMITSRPVLGFGYGFENFESAAQIDHPTVPDYFAGAVHAHNIWLETAAETGWPGFALLFLFTVLRIGGLAKAWWSAMRGDYPLAWILLLWLCLECVIQLYELTNYTLRRNLGILTYCIWAGSVVLVIIVGRHKDVARKSRWETPKLD